MISESLPAERKKDVYAQVSIAAHVWQYEAAKGMDFGAVDSKGDCNMTGEKKWGAWVLPMILVVGIASLGIGGYRYYKERKEQEEARKRVIPKMNPEQEKMLREGVRKLGRAMLGVTPEQEKKIEAIWVKMPTTIDEVVELNRKTDEVFTPEQRRMVQPIRQMMQNAAVDSIIKPVQSKLSPQDYEKFSQTVKARVQQRMKSRQ